MSWQVSQVGGHEGVLGGAHRRRRTEAAGRVGRAMAGAAIGAGQDRDVRRRERRLLGGRHAGNRHRNVGRGHAGEGLAGVAQQAVGDVQSGVQRRDARGQHRPGLRGSALLPWQTPQSMVEGIGGT